MKSKSFFTHLAKKASTTMGRPAAFVVALSVIVVWAVLGPVLHFSDTWQLVINTGTTIMTFLMVFLIQNTQNRDTGAIQVKLDELIRALDGANNALLDLEELDEKTLEHIRSEYQNLAVLAKRELAQGKNHNGLPSGEVIEDS